ncbi:uncharacterized protein JCM15063_001450 [Sporobolomyces koalae]|uniref:uncharacterized protein n=1 Tax=Sporobolomyces koalae TaxID=500713 RepID=UPI0031771854
MSFWKFKSAFAAPPSTAGIDHILSTLPPDDFPAEPSPSPASSSLNSPPDADCQPYYAALDSILAEPDLLNEIKSGSNVPLVDFLSRREVVLRLGGWVVWGLGRGMELKSSANSNSIELDRRGSLLESGVLPDDLADGKLPDDLVKAETERERVGMGGTPRRKEIDDTDRPDEVEGSSPTATGADTDETKWGNFPRLCTEILAGSPPNLTDVLFQPESASSRPHQCPTPEAFLLPFWESVLGSTEQQLAARAGQVGFWARINGVLLDGPHGRQVVEHILKIPHLLPRLLALLPFCSSLNDLLLVLLRVSRPPSPLIPHTVTQTVRMLDPFSGLGKAGHVAAEELLRGVIELCSAVSKAQPGGPAGFLGPAQTAEEPAYEWRDTTLARQIADGKTVKTLLDWMLAEVVEASDSDDEDPENNPANSDDAESARQRDLRTSSLVNSIAVLVDLIRKNNSDFVEQQMLAWARRKEADALEKEMLEADGGQQAQDVPISGTDETADDKGPSVVDLSLMLTAISGRIGGLQALIRKPRSSTAKIKTAAGPLSPLTLERFRICELYAELLHCSNMSLLNRTESASALYDSNGYLISGWRSVNDLARALAGPSIPEEEVADNSAQLPASPGLTATKSSFSTSPGNYSVPSTSGLSTPSGRESLDEESGGVLTKSEAKALKEIIELAALNSERETSGAVEEELDARAETAKEANGSESGDQASTDDVEAVSDPEDTEQRRISIMSNDTVESDLPPTPSIYSVSSRQLQLTPLAPGPLLKTRFMEHGVVNTMLDLFFEYPWNNFLHNVVFDIIQQIFHGRIDRQLDRQLALSLFLDGRLCERLLAGQRRNDEAAAQRTNMRLGYMGHLALITDETVKFFDQYPDDIYAVVESAIPQPDWNEFVAATLRETRERDSTPLSGSVPLQLPTMEQAHSSGFDDDDEFPMNSSRTMRATEAGNDPGQAKAVAGEGEASLTDQFSVYLANAISNDRTDKFGSSDEDDEDDANWLGGSRFDPRDVDFALETDTRSQQTTFGFDDRFDEAGATAFRSAGGSDSDDEWAPFEGSNSTENGLSGDPFKPTVASSSSQAAVGFDNSFGSDFDSTGAGSLSGGPGDEDWGDFATAEEEEHDAFGTGPSITLPPMDAFDDFDFSESSRPTISLPESVQDEDTSLAAFEFAQPSFGRGEPEDSTVEDGSSMFGRLSIGSSGPASPASIDQKPLPHIDTAFNDTRENDAELATDEQEPMGPSMHPNAHLTEDGFVEAEVAGKTVRVPADDIVLAHKRHRSRSSSASSGHAPYEDHAAQAASSKKESPDSEDPAQAQEAKAPLAEASDDKGESEIV